MKNYQRTSRPTIPQIETELNRLKTKRSRKRNILYVLAVSVIAAAAIIIATNIWFPVLRVVGTSMQPTLRHSDVVVCVKSNKNIKRGDIIAFYNNDKILLKRVIGLPGDLVAIDQNGTVSINGDTLQENYVSALSLEPCDTELPVYVPENSYFVLGDQRITSMDSRSEMIGMISGERIIGKAKLRVWPIDKISSIDRTGGA